MSFAHGLRPEFRFPNGGIQLKFVVVSNLNLNLSLMITACPEKLKH